jgi:hypothetical protein
MTNLFCLRSWGHISCDSIKTKRSSSTYFERNLHTGGFGLVQCSCVVVFERWGRMMRALGGVRWKVIEGGGQSRTLLYYFSSGGSLF